MLIENDEAPDKVTHVIQQGRAFDEFRPWRGRGERFASSRGRRRARRYPRT